MIIKTGMVLDLNWKEEKKTAVVVEVNNEQKIMILLYLKDKAFVPMSLDHIKKNNITIEDVSAKMYKGMPMAFWFYALLRINVCQSYAVSKNDAVFCARLKDLFNDCRPFKSIIKAGKYDLYAVTCTDIKHPPYKVNDDCVHFVWFEDGVKETQIKRVKKKTIVEMYKKYFT